MVIVTKKMIDLVGDIMKHCKHITKRPNYLSEASLGTKNDFIEMGTLSNFKRFMMEYKEHRNDKYNSSMKEGRSSWSGTDDYDSYLKLLDNGDINVIKSIKVATDKKVAEISKKYEEELTNYRFDVSGQFFDIGLVLSGVPECWLQPEYTPIEKLQVELIINGTFASNVNKNDVISGASRILAIAKILETNDVQVKIKIVSCIKGYTSARSRSLFVAVDVKDYDEPINYKKCSALLSPTFLRRGVFKVMEVLSMENKKKLKGSYGKAVSVSNFIELQDNHQIDNLETKLFTRSTK